jgi:uncharacterized protein YraI
MKTNCWLLIGTFAATAAVAQVNTNKLPEIPAPANAAATIPAITPAPVTPAPATNTVAHAKKKAVKAKVVKKAAPKKLDEIAVSLVAGPATVESANLNLRGQAGLKGEVVGHLKKGDAVTVISQINLDKHAAGEPSQWAKILLPGETKAWVNTHFVDVSNNVVTAKKLNLRAGPSENYSVIGMLQKGETYNPVTVKGDWIQIEAPKTAFAFVAAMYLKQDAAAAPAPAPEPTPVAVNPPVLAAAETTSVNVPPTPDVVTARDAAAPAPAPVPTPAPAPEAAPAPAVAAAPAEPVVETNVPPPGPRIVTHEGYVRHTLSLAAPTAYELFDAGTGNSINFLNSPTTNLDLSLYNDMQIDVTGEEGMNPRWKDTPVLTVQKIIVLSSNPPYEAGKQTATPRVTTNRQLGAKGHR